MVPGEGGSGLGVLGCSCKTVWEWKNEHAKIVCISRECPNLVQTHS